MNGGVVLFSSKGSNPLKNWDVTGPKCIETVSVGMPEIQSADSSDQPLQKTSPVKVHFTATASTTNRRQPSSAAHVEKVYDEELRCFCLEIWGHNVSIQTPPLVGGGGLVSRALMTANRQQKGSLNHHHPFILILLKFMNEPVNIELSIRDTQSIVRRLKFCTSHPRIKNSQFAHCFPLTEACTPGDMSPSPGDELEADSTPSTGDTDTPSIFSENSAQAGWRVLRIDLVACTRQAFDQTFVELASMTVHASVRLKTICLLEGPVSEANLLDTLGISHWPNGAEKAPLISLPSERRQEGTPQHSDEQLACSELFTHPPTQSSTQSSSFSFTPISHHPLLLSSDPARHESDDEVLRPRHSRNEGRWQAFWPSPPPQRSRSCSAQLDLSEPLPLLASPRGDTAESSELPSFRPSLPPLPESEDERQERKKHKRAMLKAKLKLAAARLTSSSFSEQSSSARRRRHSSAAKRDVGINTLQ